MFLNVSGAVQVPLQFKITNSKLQSVYRNILYRMVKY